MDWSPAHIRILKNGYGKKTLKVVAKLVGRSEAAVGMYLAKHRDEFPRIRNHGNGRGKVAKRVAKKNKK